MVISEVFARSKGIEALEFALNELEHLRVALPFVQSRGQHPERGRISVLWFVPNHHPNPTMI